LPDTDNVFLAPCNENAESWQKIFMVNDMKFITTVISHLKMDDEFEIDVRFGLSMQCFCVIGLAICYGIFYISVGIYELVYLMAFMLTLSSGMLLYSQKGGKYDRELICTGVSIQAILVHILVTYYIGNCGTVFFIISAILIPHFYPLLKLRHMLVLDIMLFIAVIVGFWIDLSHTPKYVDHVGIAFRFTLAGIGFTICLFEMYLNIFSVSTLKAVRQKLLDSASKDACLDALTGLSNRRMMSRYQTSIEADMDAPMCLAIIDIDFFKTINDSYGHAVGDKALVYLANAMKSFFRKSDMLIRWGGEEFLVFFPYTEMDSAEVLMERFRLKIQDTPIIIDGIIINISVTIGLMEHRFGTPLSDSIKIADELLYQGKTQGRNRVVKEAR